MYQLHTYLFRSRRGFLRSGELSLEDTNVSSDEGPCAVRIGGGFFKQDPMDFDYFTSVVRSDDETR